MNRLLALLWCALAGISAQALAGAYSPSVYPHSAKMLTFSHPTHENVSCESCHYPKGELSSLPPPELPKHHRVCEQCHSQVEEKESCKYCHTGQPAPIIRKRNSLKFSHSLHTDMPESCQSCHRPEQQDEDFGLLPGVDIFPVSRWML